MANPLFGPILRQYLVDNDDAGMKDFCDNLHPATIAETLSDDFPIEDSWRVLSHTEIRKQAAVFEYFDSAHQVAMVGGAGKPQMARLIEQMSHDDRVDLVRRLTSELADSLLRLVDEADRRDIATLVKYPENTVGSLMTTDYAWLPENLSAEEAIGRLRQQAPDRETIYYIYVIEESTRKLRGIVSLRDLILAPQDARVRDLMETDLVTLKANEDREKAAQQLARFDLIALPVIDDEDRLVGIVTHDDAIDVVVQEATEDIQRQGAVGPITENYLEANFLTIWRKRAFWLACLFGAELFTFTALSSFEDEIAKLVVLSLFIPLCLSTGGNSGSQAATLITRSIALGQLSVKDWFRVLRHELMMGVVLGLTLGTIGLIRGAATPEHTRSATKERPESFLIRVPNGTSFDRLPDRRVVLPKGSTQLLESDLDQVTYVTLPEGKTYMMEPSSDPKITHIKFPQNCVISNPPVDRWRLAMVIAQSVAAICLWGTLVGSMLPLVFKRVGVDPGLASSPFVATFVDVTGIIIYFTIAKVNLF
jgi:magnesium transporter